MTDSRKREQPGSFEKVLSGNTVCVILYTLGILTGYSQPVILSLPNGWGGRVI